VPERTAEEVRKEIAAERLGLRQDVDALKRELRSLLPFLIAGLSAVAFLVGGALIGIKRIRKRR
jgi:hypothetical protein